MGDKMKYKRNEEINYLIKDFNANYYHYVSTYEQTELEPKRQAFVDCYNIKKIKELNLKNYCYKDGKKSTFCNRLRDELHELGSMNPRFDNKAYFAVWYEKGNKKHKVIYANNNDALNDIKNKIITILNAAEAHDYNTITKEKIAPLYKYKLLNTYYPNEFINAYSEKDVELFLSKLNITYSKFDSFIDKQRKLSEWRKNNKETKRWSNYVLVVFLYYSYKHKMKKRIKNIIKNKNNDDEYEEKIQTSINLGTSKYGEPPEHVKGRSTKKIEKVYINGKPHYKRDASTIYHALILANHKCEFCESHKTFIRSKDGTNYVEGHHLIPMKYQKEFKNIPIDIEENVVALCSNCHSEIHYGKNRDKIIKKLFNEREQLLKDKEIYISLSKLLSYYK